VQAIVAALEFDERTVAAWWARVKIDDGTLVRLSIADFSL